MTPSRPTGAGHGGRGPQRRRRGTLTSEDLTALLRQLEQQDGARAGASGGRAGRSDRELERLRRLLAEAIAAEEDGAAPGRSSEDAGPRDVGADDPFDDAADFEDDPFGDDLDEEEDRFAVGRGRATPDGAPHDGAGDDDAAWYDDGADLEAAPAWRPGGRWTRYETARPIKVDAGLALQSRRGTVATTWWSRRFLAAVESTAAGGRLSSGRSYARKGQIVDLTIGTGLIESHVQGTRRTPYAVRIAMPPPDDGEWARVVDELAGQAGHAARLLAGDLPHEIEDIFAAAGVTLFPSPSSRLSTDCSCPDWANPCKHVAAVCFLVAESFDRDPFLLLAWRGRDRETLLAQLRERRGATAPPHQATAEAQPDEPPLSACTVGFFKAGPALAQLRILPRASAVPGAVLRPMTRGLIDVRGRDVADVLEPLYQHLGRRAEQRAYGPAGSPDVGG